MDAKTTIKQGLAVLGIEFGSTRIKAVLIDNDNNPIAQGSYEWENKLVDGLWTYSLEDICNGLQACYASLRENVQELYSEEIETLSAIGISAMMHGYMPFDKEGKLLVPFRTWRNNITGEASVHGATPIRERPQRSSQSCFISTCPCDGAPLISIRPYSMKNLM